MVQEIGAFAGFAAGVGLAVLAALCCSQARDIRRLREWAARAPERSGRGVTASPSPQRPIHPRRSQPRCGRIGARQLTAALVGLLVVGGAAAYGVSRLTGGDDHGDARTVSPDKPKRKDAAIEPGNVTVAVLNGTTVPGLAAALSDQLVAGGFKRGIVDVFSDQALAESVVQYAPGHEAAAKAVGRRVGITERAPVTAAGRALAGAATVIVIAGADKAP